MIDQDKMRALAARQREEAELSDFQPNRKHYAAFMRESADAIDLLLAEVEAANSLFTEMSDYLQCVVDSSMSRNNSQNLATELLTSIEKLLQNRAELEAAAADKQENLTGDRLTDRELLELAAKAANQERSFAGDLWSSARGCLWDPLGNDVDAFRLAVKLGIGMVHYFGWGQVFHRDFDGDRIDFHYDPDAHTATRRAIVRAAAEIGKAGA